ncbi:uncharacterized protein AB675_2630 [Cyphellophora attinorum]|uniref:Uncharacterized protein n=1 Tax=Cyphellophora attinorum TaxID=1664694 RepID=A0A0N1HAI4_9EURO|nr:uncharacterized protein AB675_2630 [Phialophora attinorum]KPI44970.1 hypothetical protein AB675_2630 [Phialophora attinorum]
MPPQPEKGECPTTTVTMTQYAATITKTVGIDDIHNATSTSSPPTTIKTISLYHISHNSTLTTSHKPSTISHSATLTPSPSPSDAASDASHQAGRVAGDVIGSLAGLALLIFLLAWCCKRKKQIKLKLRCSRETKEEKEAARQEEERKRAEEERKKALEQLESRPGDLAHSGLTFGFAGLGGGEKKALPLRRRSLGSR